MEARGKMKSALAIGFAIVFCGFGVTSMYIALAALNEPRIRLGRTCRNWGDVPAWDVFAIAPMALVAVVPGVRICRRRCRRVTKADITSPYPFLPTIEI